MADSDGFRRSWTKERTSEPDFWDWLTQGGSDEFGNPRSWGDRLRSGIRPTLDILGDTFGAPMGHMDSPRIEYTPRDGTFEGWLKNLMTGGRLWGEPESGSERVRPHATRKAVPGPVAPRRPPQRQYADPQWEIDTAMSAGTGALGGGDVWLKDPSTGERVSSAHTRAGYEMLDAARAELVSRVRAAKKAALGGAQTGKSDERVAREKFDQGLKKYATRKAVPGPYDPGFIGPVAPRKRGR